MVRSGVVVFDPIGVWQPSKKSRLRRAGVEQDSVGAGRAIEQQDRIEGDETAAILAGEPDAKPPGAEGVASTLFQDLWRDPEARAM